MSDGRNKSREWNALKPAEQFFCCAIADDAEWHAGQLLDLYEACGDDEAFRFSDQNRAASVVGLALRGVLPEGKLPQRWTDAIEKIEKRLKLFMHELDRAADVLHAEDIKLLALKNSGIARGIFPHLAGCPMGDVDVLVDPKDFRRAHAKMLTLDYKLDSRSPLEVEGLEEAEQEGGAEYYKTLEDGSEFWFELQWRPVAGRWIQPDQEPPAADLVARSVGVAGTHARLLSPVDNLLQVCLHTAKHSYVRAPGFRLHTDVDRIVRRNEIDWPKFVALVKATGVRTAAYISLRIPKELLRTPIPDDVLKQLSPAAWKRGLLHRWVKRVGLFNPDAQKWSKSGYVLFNLCLYDSFGGIWRAVFPDGQTMIKRYNIKRRWTLPWYYLVRGWDLAFKRANT